MHNPPLCGYFVHPSAEHWGVFLGAFILGGSSFEGSCGFLFLDFRCTLLFGASADAFFVFFFAFFTAAVFFTFFCRPSAPKSSSSPSLDATAFNDSVGMFVFFVASVVFVCF
jgi:hypothetical protein